MKSMNLVICRNQKTLKNKCLGDLMLICNVCKVLKKRPDVKPVKTDKFKKKKDSKGNVIRKKKAVVRYKSYCNNCKRIIG